jgi:hypothetical protein
VPKVKILAIDGEEITPTMVVFHDVLGKLNKLFPRGVQLHIREDGYTVINTYNRKLKKWYCAKSFDTIAEFVDLIDSKST